MRSFRISFFFLGLIFAAYSLWPRPLAKKLEQQLQKSCAEATLEQTLAPLEARFKAKELVSILAPEVLIDYHSPDQEFTRSIKKAELMDQLTAALLQLQSSKAVISRFKVLSADAASAKVSLFFIAEWKMAGEQELSRAAEDVRLEFEKIDGSWLITKIATLPRVTL
jgi:fructose-bisphosphate aldolase class 1